MVLGGWEFSYERGTPVWKEVRREGYYRSRVTSHSASVLKRVQVCSSEFERVGARSSVFKRVQACSSISEQVGACWSVLERVRVSSSEFERVGVRASVFKRVQACSSLGEAAYTEAGLEVTKPHPTR